MAMDSYDPPKIVRLNHIWIKMVVSQQPLLLLLPSVFRSFFVYFHSFAAFDTHKVSWTSLETAQIRWKIRNFIQEKLSPISSTISFDYFIGYNWMSSSGTMNQRVSTAKMITLVLRLTFRPTIPHVFPPGGKYFTMNLLRFALRLSGSFAKFKWEFKTK